MKQPDKIFNLTISEIYDAVQKLIPSQGLAARIADRSKQLAENKAATAEEVILRHGDPARSWPHPRQIPPGHPCF